MEASPAGWKPACQVVASSNFWHQGGHEHPILFAGTGEGRGRPWALQPMCRVWPLLRRARSLWDGIKQQRATELLCEWENPGRTVHTVSPCPAWSTANHLPAKARAAEASQQDGTEAVGWTDISYRAVSGRSWSLLTWAPWRTCIHQGQPCARHWNCLPKTPVPPHTCKDSAPQRCPGLGFAGCKCEYSQ